MQCCSATEGVLVLVAWSCRSSRLCVTAPQCEQRRICSVEEMEDRGQPQQMLTCSRRRLLSFHSGRQKRGCSCHTDLSSTLAVIVL